MPLDAASRIMLPTYVALSTLYGLDYLIDPGDRLKDVPALTFQRSLMPMHIWGLLMLGIAAAMALAMIAGSRPLFSGALALNAVAWAAWGTMYAVSATIAPHTSLLAPVLSWFVAVSCVALMTSLMHEEV